MHETNFAKLGMVASKFDFSNEIYRQILCQTKEFTYGHYSVNGGTITIGGTVVNKKLYFAISMCSPEDNFSKKLGRNYVIENLIDPSNSKMRGVYPRYDLALDDAKKPADVLKTALESHLRNMRQRPHWMAKNVEVLFRGIPRKNVQSVTNKDIAPIKPTISKVIDKLLEQTSWKNDECSGDEDKENYYHEKIVSRD
jgi:hypothetical protein